MLDILSSSSNHDKNFKDTTNLRHFQKEKPNKRNWGLRVGNTTRKSDNTNEITDGNNSVSNSVESSRQKNSVGDAAGINFIGIYRRLHRQREIFFENCNGGMTWILFRRIYRRNIPRDSNPDSQAGTCRYHWQNQRRIYRRNIPSVNFSIYCLCRHSLFLCFSFFFPFFFHILPLTSQTAANHPSQLSPFLNTS